MWSCLEENEPLDLGVEVGELKKKNCASIGLKKRKQESTAIGQQRIATIIF